MSCVIQKPLTIRSSAVRLKKRREETKAFAKRKDVRSPTFASDRIRYSATWLRRSHSRGEILWSERRWMGCYRHWM